LIGVFDAWQLNNDTPLALKLHQWFGHSQTVNSVLYDDTRRLHGLGIEVRLLVRWDVSLKQNLQPSLQVKTLVNSDVTINADITKIEVQTGVVWLIDPDQDSRKQDDADQKTDVALAHRCLCSLPGFEVRSYRLTGQTEGL
jgi:hypothetical protein